MIRSKNAVQKVMPILVGTNNASCGWQNAPFSRESRQGWRTWSIT